MVFQPNNNANPKGRPVTGYQTFSERAAYWLEKKTINEIKALMGDETAKGDLGAYDLMILMRIMEAINADGGQSMDRLLDRILGKPKQEIAAVNTNINLNKDMDEAKEAQEEARSMLGILAKKKAKEAKTLN